MVAPISNGQARLFVGRRIRALRRAAGLSAANCASAAGMWSGDRQWTRYEAGYRLPNCMTLWRIARALGVSADALCPPECAIGTQARKTRALMRSPAFTTPLTGRERQWLRWFADREPAFWECVEWSAEHLIAFAGRTGREGKAVRREVLRQRIRLLEASGRIVYLGNGRYRLSKRFYISPPKQHVLPVGDK